MDAIPINLDLLCVKCCFLRRQDFISVFYRADSSPHCSSEPEHHFGESFTQERGQYLHSPGHWALLQTQLPEPSLFRYILIFFPCCYGRQPTEWWGNMRETCLAPHLNCISGGFCLQGSSFMHFLADSKAPSKYVNTTYIQVPKSYTFYIFACIQKIYIT